jgi:hypothetical protein
MNKDRKIPDLQNKSLKEQPFGVPEGYFESFAERVQERIREEESGSTPLRRIGTSRRLRVAMAAAVLGVALISYSIFRFMSTDRITNGDYLDMAILEQMYIFDDEHLLYELMEIESEVLDEDEAFATQAIEYLAINDADMVLLFE